MANSSSNPNHISLPSWRRRGEFVGRQQEMADLKAALEDAMSGRGRLVMLVGEPGIGKTRTAQELGSHAESQGALVLWGRCYEEEGAPPYWPWLQSLRSYIQQQTPEQLQLEMGPGASDIAEIIPDLRHKLTDLETPPALEPEQARFRLFNSITTFLKNAAQSQPLMLVLDDLHWADRSSLLLLEYIAREIQSSPLLVLGTYRDVEVSSRHPLSVTMGSLIREQLFQRVHLRGLSSPEVARFVEVRGIDPLPRLVQAVHERTEGNPFFAGEVVELLRQEGSQEGRGWSFGIPEGVRDVIGRRLDRLSQSCNDTLAIASVMGREFHVAPLVRMSGDPPGDRVLAALEEALTAHVIEEVPGSAEGYLFTHALIQETLAGELSAASRMRLHARIAESLEEVYGANSEAHAAELAHHFGQAKPVLGPEKLVRYSLLAGEQALASFAWENAILHFQRGLEAKDGDPTDAETAALLVGCGYAQLASLPPGQAIDAVAGLNRAFDYYVGIGDVNSAVAAAEYPRSTNSGAIPGIAQLVERALRLVPPDSLPACRLLLRHGWDLGRMRGDYPGAQEAFHRALTIASGNGNKFLEMESLAAAAEVDVFNLACQEAMVKSRRVIELLDQFDNPWAEVQAHQRATLACTIIGDLEGARRHASAALAPAERLHDLFWLTSSLWGKQFVHRLEGNWEAARETCDRLLSLAETPRPVSDRVMLEYQQGDFAQGKFYLDKLLEVHRRMKPGQTSAYVMPALILPLINRLDPEADHLEYAQSLAEELISSLSASPLVSSVARAGLALLAVLRQDETEVQEHYSALLALGGTMLHTGVIAVDRLLGLLSETAGKPDQAERHFEDALSFCRKAGYRAELAWTCCDFADTFLQRNDTGDRQKAMSLLDESLAISTELGMRPLKERVTERLERIQAQPSTAPAYPDGLTPREVEVLRLITDGKTDRGIAEELFLSTRTVTTHVRNILNKTNAANRAEAAAYALRNGLA